MKNKSFYKILSLVVITALIVSCSYDQKVDAVVQVSKPTMTIAIAPTATVNEGGSLPFTLTLSSPVSEEFNVFIMLDGQNSTADKSDSDVSSSTSSAAIQKVVTIAPFQTVYNGTINIANDDLTEPTEILSLIIGESRTTAVNFVPATTKISITNVVLNELNLSFNFNRTFSAPNGYTNSLCALVSPIATPATGYDVDFIVYKDPSNTPLPVYDAQTGACTEKLTMNLANFTDGLYHIKANLYTNGDLDTVSLINSIPQFNIPITVDYLRSGSINAGTYTQEASNFFTSATAVGSENPVVDVLISTVGGVRKFTIKNTAGVVSASGKFHNSHKN